MDKLSTAEGVVKNDLSWLQRHERLLLGTFVLAIVMFLGNKWLDKSAMDAHETQAAVAQQLLEAKQNNEKLSAAVAQQSAQYAQDRATFEKEITALVGAMASRDAASARKVEDVSKPKDTPAVIQDLVQAYQGAVPAPKIEQDGGLAFAPTVVQLFTVTKIEKDTAVADLKDQKDINAKQYDQIAKANDLVFGLGKQVDGLNTQMTLQGKKCEADLSVVKADGRKSKRNWFIRGMAAGGAVVAYLALHGVL